MISERQNFPLHLIFPQISLITWWIFFLLTDGDKDKEDIRRWTIGTDDAGGREKLLRAVRPGE